MTTRTPLPSIAHSAKDDTTTVEPTSPRKMTLVRSLLVLLGLLLLAAVSTAWWALDRFVIDHVEIGDVAAYESSVLDESATSLATEYPTSEYPMTGTLTSDANTGSTYDSAEVSGTDTVITATSYQSDHVSIEISTVVGGSGTDTVTYYVADVIIDDASSIRAGFAENAFGTNIIADTSEIAGYYDAAFAINGDYYGFRDSGIVIRNGVAYRDDGARTGLVLYTDGSMAVYDETTTSADELLADGAWNTWSFGPAIVDDAQVVNGIENVEVDTNFGNHSIQGEQPRTGVGVIADNHFVFVVVDGRSPGYSRGVTMTEFADIFVGLGAATAYNLDGGGSSTMYFNGDLVNNPLGKNTERGTSDIIYIG